jgi:two-component system, cell cycle sensor histidine kinase and response regulator CckA
MKILIVDDNEINRKLLRVTLQAEGLDTVEASDGVEALETLESEEVDVIISDILMPNMDGYRFCHAIRTHPRLNQLPFIVYTSTYESPGDEKLSMRFGADKFIRRPSPLEEILSAIHEVTEKPKRRQRTAISPPDELEVVKTYSVHLVQQLEEKNHELTHAHAKILEMHQALLRRTDELEESEEKFRSIFENILDVFYRTDMQGNIQLISPSVQRYGYPSDALLGTNIQNLYAAPFDREHLIATLEEKGTVEDWEITLKRQDGEPFVASLSARLLTDFQRRSLGIEGTLRDITERKRLEAQLLQAQRLESVGQLAGGIAHDFNNFLTAMFGYAELAELDIAPEHPAHACLQNIQSAAERAAGLTRQLLAFARQQIIEPRVVNLNDLILNIGMLIRPLLGEDIQLVMLPGAELWRVRVDPGQVEQVLVNLAVNARDAMPQGGKLTIETKNVTLDGGYSHVRPEVVPGDYVMVAVSDNGTGMEASIQQRIFDPFFTTKEVGKGTGLGLATCHGIVKQSGGHIWVYSEPGHGTTFKVYFPRVQEAISASPSPAAVVNSRGVETILLVEDEIMVRAIGVEALRLQGYTVLEAGNGREALELVQAYPGDIHLLLTDVVMPQMSGKQLAEHLLEARPDLRVIYVSGYTHNTIVHHGVLDEGITFLQKPYTSAMLARKVREVLDGNA